MGRPVPAGLSSVVPAGFAGMADTDRHDFIVPGLTDPFRRLVEGARDYAIFLLDPAGRITSWNAGAQQIKGYSAAEVLGRHFSMFYSAEAKTAKWPDLELQLARTRGRFEDEGWRIRKDGTAFWANVVITALKDERGTLRGFSKITRDLSERRRH